MNIATVGIELIYPEVSDSQDKLLNGKVMLYLTNILTTYLICII